MERVGYIRSSGCACVHVPWHNALPWDMIQRFTFRERILSLVVAPRPGSAETETGTRIHSLSQRYRKGERERERDLSGYDPCHPSLFNAIFDD